MDSKMPPIYEKTVFFGKNKENRSNILKQKLLEIKNSENKTDSVVVAKVGSRLKNEHCEQNINGIPCDISTGKKEPIFATQQNALTSKTKTSFIFVSAVGLCSEISEDDIYGTFIN